MSNAKQITNFRFKTIQNCQNSNQYKEKIKIWLYKRNCGYISMQIILSQMKKTEMEKINELNP